MSHIKHTYTRKIIITSLFLLFISLAGSAYGLTYLFSPSTIAPGLYLSALCRQSDEMARAKCYEQNTAELYPRYSVKEIFNVIEGISVYDEAMRDCHFVSHRLGKVVTGLDPSRWAEHLQEESFHGTCSYGYSHGVGIAAFNDRAETDAGIAELIPQFKDACARKAAVARDYGILDRVDCTHSLGHLFYYVAGHDLQRAFDICDKVVPDYSDKQKIPVARTACYTGVGMMLLNFTDYDKNRLEQDVEPEKLTALRTETRAMCYALRDPGHISGCLRGRWYLYAKEILSGEGLSAFCADQPTEEGTRQCHEKLAVSLGWRYVNEMEKIDAALKRVDAKYQSSMYGTAAQEVLNLGGGLPSIPKTLHLCNMAPENVRGACTAVVAGSAQFYYAPHTKEFARYCSKLPAEFQKHCLKASE